MGSSFPKNNRADSKSIAAADEKLKQSPLSLSNQFPVALFTQNYSHAVSDSIPLHWHDEMQLIWVYEGELAYTVNDETITINGDQLLFISGRQLHSSRITGNNARSLCINFTIEVFHPLISEFFSISFLDQLQKPYATLPLKSYQLLWLKDLLYWEPTIIGYHFLMNFLSQAFWEYMNGNLEDGKRTPVASINSDLEETELFHDILIYVQSHFAEPLTIKELSNYALINKNKLTSLFKKHTNMSPIKYLNDYRLYVAKNLLITTSKSISEIAAEVGYHQTSYFIEQFRERYGMSPLKYRNNYKNKHTENPSSCE